MGFSPWARRLKPAALFLRLRPAPRPRPPQAYSSSHVEEADRAQRRHAGGFLHFAQWRVSPMR